MNTAVVSVFQQKAIVQKRRREQKSPQKIFSSLSFLESMSPFLDSLHGQIGDLSKDDMKRTRYKNVL